MIDKICMFLTKKIRENMPDIDDERAEIINYGLQNIIGELPKFFILFAVAYILGVFKLTIITFLVLLAYRGFSGGLHMNTHIGCIITTCALYCGVPMISKIVVLNPNIKYLLIATLWVFGIIMIKLYAPADTENVPILRKKDRRNKQILAYISFTIGLIIAIFIKDNVIANIIIFGYLVQTLMITKLAYRLTNNKYGYEVYENASI